MRRGKTKPRQTSHIVSMYINTTTVDEREVSVIMRSIPSRQSHASIVARTKANAEVMDHLRRAAWLPTPDKVLQKWIKYTVEEVEDDGHPAVPIHPVLQEFKKFIDSNDEIHDGFHRMFTEQKSMLATHIPDYNSLIRILDKIIREAPLYGEVGPPIYMVINQAMNTRSGFTTFLNPELNAWFKRIFDIWSEFLDSPASSHVLHKGEAGWFSPPVLAALVADYDGLSFEEIFVCDPSLPHWGFTSWDNFFNRTFREGVRPVEHADDPDIISAACESNVYNIAHNVQEKEMFWIKGESYSITDMLNHDEYTPQFAGGTIFQGFLQVTGYHRWASPVTGTIRKLVLVPGTYFCQAPNTLETKGHPYHRCLAFISHITTRMLVFIESDNPKIGLMCFISIGMNEVSTCEATVKEGQRVERGDDMGMFHFGGSTHVLLFRKETRVEFFEGRREVGDLVRVRGAVARAV